MQVKIEQSQVKVGMNISFHYNREGHEGPRQIQVDYVDENHIKGTEPDGSYKSFSRGYIVGKQGIMPVVYVNNFKIDVDWSHKRSYEVTLSTTFEVEMTREELDHLDNSNLLDHNINSIDVDQIWDLVNEMKRDVKEL